MHSSPVFDDKRLQELVREKERESVTTSSSHVANTVGHVKQSLMLKMDRFTARKQDYQPERNVVVNKIEAEDSLEKLKEEEARKERERANRKRLEEIQQRYSRNKEEDKYNPDYYFCVCGTNRRSVHRVPLHTSVNTAGIHELIVVLHDAIVESSVCIPNIDHGLRD